MLKQFRRQPAQDDHESLFMRLYDQLLRQATELTGDAAQAEDLLHDAFINFTLRRPALERLHNVEGYLYRMIRNLFVSEVRRRAQMQTVSLAPGDYETAQLGLRALPPNDQTRAELLSICHYACVRKESAPAASALILRFFHGYVVQETATLLRAPKQQITDWLKLARREARLFRADPTRLKFLSGESAGAFPAPAALQPGEDVIEQLRALILQARQGECFTAAEWRQLYSPEKRWALETPFAAHLASCAVCLRIVSEAHRMPTPDERDPTAMSGPHDRPATPRRKHPKFNSERTSGSERLRICQQRRAETFNHHPSELHIAVNGFPLLSQTIAGAANEQTMRINIDEAISFVEVFSEQGVRLLLLEIEPPADGALEQHESLAFSDGRRLSVTLTCDRAWPQLHVAYFDPTLEDYGLRMADGGVEETRVLPSLFAPTSGETEFFTYLKSAISNPQSAIRWLLRPVTVTVLLAIVLLTVVVGQKLGWWFAAPARLAPREIRPGRIAPEHTPTILPKAETNLEKTAASSLPTTSAMPPAVSAVASAELEIEALRLLRDARADLNEQIEVNRRPNGKLRIEGILETDQRKAEILAALAPVKDHPAIEIDLKTVAEAVQRQRAQPRAAAPEPVVEQTEITAAALPVEADLRRHFTARGVDDARMEAAIRGFAAATIANAHRLRSHATTLKRLAGRFSGAELEQLDPQARTQWRELLRHHARGLLDETLALRAALAPVFGADSRDESPAPFDLQTNEGMRRACDQLAVLCLETDRAISAAFTLSARSASPSNNADNAAAALRTAGFHTRLHRIEHLAAALSRWE